MYLKLNNIYTEMQAQNQQGPGSCSTKSIWLNVLFKIEIRKSIVISEEGIQIWK